MADLDKTVDPALWPLIEAFPPIDLSAATLPGFRAAMVELSVKPDPSTHTDVLIEEVRAPTVRCLHFRSAERAPVGGLLHVHGGGFVMGMPEMDVARNIELVRATGCEILSVDYRLAPEHPYPAGLEDCLAAFGWFAGRAKASRIGVIGESAGGGIAAELARRVRERLACQVLVYPMLVPPGLSVEGDLRTGRYIWTRASNGFCWSAYLGGAQLESAPDLTGLPPSFIAVGELDLFVHDNLAYAQKLLAAGCSVEAHVYPGAVHGFDRMVEAEVSRRYTRDLVGFIERNLRSPQSPGG